jgi:TolA-binding protein
VEIPQIEQDRPASPAASGKADAVTTPVSAGRDFALAMAAFSAGDYGRAERLFLAFGQDHPADARVEDATFLIAVARSRRGDVDGAGKIARQYLQRYPSGLRRVEAERLAR